MSRTHPRKPFSVKNGQTLKEWTNIEGERIGGVLLV